MNVFFQDPERMKDECATDTVEFGKNENFYFNTIIFPHYWTNSNIFKVTDFFSFFNYKISFQLFNTFS